MDCGRADVAVSNAGCYSRNVSVLLNDGDWGTPPPPPKPDEVVPAAHGAV